MGNNPSKTTESPVSPAANHLPSSSFTYSRKQRPSPTQISHNTKAPSTEKSSQLDNIEHIIHSDFPSHRHAHENTMGNDISRQRPYEDRKKERPKNSAKSTPVKVPRGSDPKRQRGPDSQFEPSGLPRDPNHIPHSNLNFPPRLPLPIEEEVHTPGSPILTPQGASSSLREDDIDGPLPRQTSAVSSTTIEDDELGDELRPYPYEAPPRGTVPTILEWKQGGERVYVTGTFTGWSRKFRMNRE